MKRREFLRRTAAAASLFGLTACGAPDGRGGGRPNILFCIADDATWMHLGAYGCSWVKTPGFDRVAADGIPFQ